jgi:hypothetical protein
MQPDLISYFAIPILLSKDHRTNSIRVQKWSRQAAVALEVEA